MVAGDSERLIRNFQVVGWGLTGLDDTAKPSPVLKMAELPFIPRDRCFKTVPIGLWSAITLDKFCAGHINGAYETPYSVFTLRS